MSIAVSDCYSSPLSGIVPSRWRQRLEPCFPVRNALLQALGEKDLARVLPYLERVPLRRGQTLHESHRRCTHAYFIESGVASLLARAGERGTLEVATLTHRDFVGMAAILGIGASPHSCVVQIPGEALRIRADRLESALVQAPALRRVLLAYIQAAIAHTAQLVVCSTCHGLQERVARWLAVAHDARNGDEPLLVTHDALSWALGARRAGVTKALGNLEEAGIVRRGRGRMTVRNRTGLEAAACKCLEVIRKEYETSLSAAEG